MKTIRFREIQGQIERHYSIPQFGLRLGYYIMGSRQLLNVVGSAQEGIVVKLRVPGLHHMQDDLGIFGVVLIPTVMEGFSCAC